MNRKQIIQSYNQKSFEERKNEFKERIKEHKKRKKEHVPIFKF